MFYVKNKGGYMNSKKDCAGTYPVSGYVRKDGTEVSSYMRTCGAKHEGGVNYLSEEEKEYVRKKEYLEYLKYMNSLSRLQENIGKADLPFDYFKQDFFKYYKLSLDFNNQKEINKDNVYIKFGEIKDDKTKTFIKENCNIPYLTDYTDVVIPQFDSSFFNTVMNSDELKNALKEEYEKILKGEYKNKYFDVNFNQTKDAHLTLGKAKLYNMRVVDDYICGTLIDYYDFDKLNISTDDKYDSLITKIANNNAYYQQEIGRLHNYLILMPVRFSLEKF